MKRVALVLCLLALTHVHDTAAATVRSHVWIVTSTADDGGPGTLRTALSSATSGDTISFSPRLAGSTVLLSRGPLDLARSVVLRGPEVGTPALTISAGNRSAVFHVPAGVSAELDDLTITGGAAWSPPGTGGAIDNQGTVLVQRCLIVANSALDGGGIYNGGSLLLENTRVADNHAQSIGGIDSTGRLVAHNLLVLDNSSNEDAGGMANAGDAWLTSGQLAFNSADFSTAQLKNGGRLHMDAVLIGPPGSSTPGDGAQADLSGEGTTWVHDVTLHGTCFGTFIEQGGDPWIARCAR